MLGLPGLKWYMMLALAWGIETVSAELNNPWDEALSGLNKQQFQEKRAKMSDIVLERQTCTKENVWFEGQKSYFLLAGAQHRGGK